MTEKMNVCEQLAQNRTGGGGQLKRDVIHLSPAEKKVKKNWHFVQISDTNPHELLMLKTHLFSRSYFSDYLFRRVRAANIVRRPCSDSRHVTAPYKLSFRDYFIITNQRLFSESGRDHELFDPRVNGPLGLRVRIPTQNITFNRQQMLFNEALDSTVKILRTSRQTSHRQCESR